MHKKTEERKSSRAKPSCEQPKETEIYIHRTPRRNPIEPKKNKYLPE
jgi:hypothetical protein